MGTEEVEMPEMEQAAGSASSTPENSPQPDNPGGTITLEPSSPKPNNATLDTTGGTTQGAQPQPAEGANVLDQPTQGPRDAQPQPDVAVPCTDDQGTSSSNLVTGCLTSSLSLSQMQRSDLDNNKQLR